jgi:predicted secreted protein
MQTRFDYGFVSADSHVTEPDEVADMAIEGVREGRFWILSKLGKSDERLRTRTQSILERENPEPTQ